MFALSYDGLRKRETYDEVVDYIQNRQEQIKYPNRLAKQIRDSPQLSNLLDGDGGNHMDLLNQQNRVVVEQAKEAAVKKIAETTDLTANQFNTMLDRQANTAYFNMAQTDNDEIHESTIEERRLREIEMTKKNEKQGCIK